MATIKSPPVVGVFPDRGRAESAIDELWHAGFHKDQIGIVIPGHGVHEATTATESLEEKAAGGATTGAITGGAIGAVLGAVVIAVAPGIGPVIAGGMLAGIAASVVGGAAAGAAVGTFLGPFIALGISEEDARRYQGELAAGRTVLVVQPRERAREAITILSEHGPLEVHLAGEANAVNLGIDHGEWVSSSMPK
jgi:hypothetical protein